MTRTTEPLPAASAGDAHERAPRTRRGLAGSGGRDWILVGVVAVVVVALALILLKFVILIAGSFHRGSLMTGEGYTLDHYRRILTDPTFVRTALNTLRISVGTLVVMLAISVPAAWIYTRTDFRGNRFILLLFTANVAVPGFLVALAYQFMLNPTNGVINLTLRGLYAWESGPVNIYSMWWIALLQGISLAGAAFFMMAPTFRAIDSALEEAAVTSGLSQGTTLRTVVLPVVAPAILGTTIYYFVVSMEMFDYAALLGLPRGILVFSTWIYELLNPANSVPEYGAASAVGLIFTLVAVLLVFVYFKMIGSGERFAVLAGKRGAQHRIALSRRQSAVAWTCLAVLATVSLVAPILSLVWTSLLPYLQAPSRAAVAAMNLDSYRVAIQELPALLQTTVILVISVPTVSVLLALCTSWYVMRTRKPGRRVIDLLIMAAIGTPAIVGALAFLYAGLAVYRWLPVYGSVWLVVIAMGARYITWASRSLNSAMLQIGKELEESAATSGLSLGRSFVSIVVPLVLPAIGFSWYWIALLALRELSIPVLLMKDDTQVIATSIFGFDVAGSTGVAAALGVLLLATILVLVGVGQLVTGRRARRSGVREGRELVG